MFPPLVGMGRRTTDVSSSMSSRPDEGEVPGSKGLPGDDRLQVGGMRNTATANRTDAAAGCWPR